MRQTIAKMVGKSRGKNLRFGFQSAKRPRMDDAVAITCILTAVGMRWFWKATATRMFRPHSPGRWCRRFFDEPLPVFLLSVVIENGEVPVTPQKPGNSRISAKA